MEKIFAVYKPKGPTSNDVLEKIRKITGEKKVGHAGTLDPLAEGVLVVGVGRTATKRLSEFTKHEKEYLAKIKLGEKSTTDDEEGEKTKVKVDKAPSQKEVREVVLRFVGEIKQTPPIYSAVKIKGREAYKRARRGEKVILEPRKVEVRQIEILSYNWPYLNLRITTGPGVYVRSLARDIGKALKTDGYLKNLERTRVGDFNKEKAVRMKNLESYLISF